MVLASCGPEVTGTPVVVDPPVVVEPPVEPVVYAPEVQQFGDIPSDVTVEIVGNRVVLTNGVNTIFLARHEAKDAGVFKAYADDTAASPSYSHAFFAETSSGGGYAGVGISKTTSDLGGIIGGEYGRLSDTELPETGSATFTGQYVGEIAILPNYNLGASFTGDVEPITGDVELIADFDGNEISGAITNRAQSGRTPDDVILHSTSIQNGGFSGRTSGGILVPAGSANTASDGTYSGMFVAADGQEIVGGVQIEHQSGNTRIESGVFILEK